MIWCVQLGGGGANASKAMRRLAEKHAAEPKVAQAIPEHRLFLLAGGRDASAGRHREKPRPDGSGHSHHGPAQYIKRRIDLIRTLKENETRARELEPFLTAQGFDKEAIARLKSTDPADAAKEVESLFEKVEKEFADISSGRGTLGKSAKSELNEMRNLGVGKPSPEITGNDIDGKPFKLSDYRGKVVVVDFWGDW